LNYERAIVTDIAGTTRDVIEETLDVDGIPLTIFDTAGIRECNDENEHNKIEQIGINYSLKFIEEADIVMFLFDLSKGFSAEDEKILETIKDKKKIIIGTKADLNKKNNTLSGVIEISNLNKANIDVVLDKLRSFVYDYDTTENSDFLTNSRQQESLLKAKTSLENVLTGLRSREIQDFISIDLTQAVSYLGEITGDDISQEIIDNIFEKFCIGK
jgi:tRNA modification GTPase